MERADDDDDDDGVVDPGKVKKKKKKNELTLVRLWRYLRSDCPGSGDTELDLEKTSA